MLQPRAWARPAHSSYCIHSALRSYATAARTKSKTKFTPKDAAKARESTGKVAQTTTVTKDAVYVQPEKPAPTKALASNSSSFLRSYTPRTPGVRHLRRPINDHLWKGRPYRKLTFPKKGGGRGGRNSSGRITVRHRGGGHKRRIRTVDFDRMAPGKHTVDRVEHDPNRTAHIALVTNEKTGDKSYIIAAEGMREGDTIQSYRAGLPGDLIKAMGGTVDPGMLAAKTALRGNCMPIRMVPLGTQIFNVGSTTGKGAVFCRSAGTFAIVISKEETAKKCREVVVRLQSGELRRVSPDACATIGVASNPHFHFRQLGKAGRSRWLGIRPTVRGLAMNACDHPHGGGRGKTKGNNIPVSIWGTPAKSGYKTRYKRNENKWMVADRPRNQGKRRSKA